MPRRMNKDGTDRAMAISFKAGDSILNIALAYGTSSTEVEQAIRRWILLLMLHAAPFIDPPAASADVRDLIADLRDARTRLESQRKYIESQDQAADELLRKLTASEAEVAALRSALAAERARCEEATRLLRGWIYAHGVNADIGSVREEAAAIMAVRDFLARGEAEASIAEVKASRESWEREAIEAGGGGKPGTESDPDGKPEHTAGERDVLTGAAAAHSGSPPDEEAPPPDNGGAPVCACGHLVFNHSSTRCLIADCNCAGEFRESAHSGSAASPTDARPAVQEMIYAHGKELAELRGRFIKVHAEAVNLREAIRDLAHGAHSGRSFANDVLAATAWLVEGET